MGALIRRTFTVCNRTQLQLFPFLEKACFQEDYGDGSGILSLLQRRSLRGLFVVHILPYLLVMAMESLVTTVKGTQNKVIVFYFSFKPPDEVILAN